MSLRIPVLAVAGLLPACGFRSYEEVPLEPERLLATAAQARVAWPEAEAGIDLAIARARLLAANPLLREKRAAHATAVAAATPTPLPNPVLQTSLDLALKTSQIVNPVVPFVSLGLTVPWSGARGAQDELNLAAVEVARVDALATARDLHLELRGRWQELLLAKQRAALRGELLQGAERAVAILHRMVEAGEAAAADVLLFELERARAAAGAADAEADASLAEAELGSMLDAAHQGLRDKLRAAAPESSPALPDASALQALLIEHHPELLRLRAHYTAAERRLRLEVCLQYPDFTFTPNYRGELNERFRAVGLPLSVPLPIFARNQQAVAEAHAAREQLRVRYEAACSRALAELEQRRRAVELAHAQRDRVRAEQLPLAQRAVAIARRAVDAGTGSALQLLESERAHRQVASDALAAEAELRAAVVALERAVGRPLASIDAQDSLDLDPQQRDPLAVPVSAGESR